MKTVDSEALKRRLEVARNGDREQQKAFLSSINYHENCIVINEMNDSDLQWIAPLALELFTPAVDVLVSGMTNKYRHWEEDFLDEDTMLFITILVKVATMANGIRITSLIKFLVDDIHDF